MPKRMSSLRDTFSSTSKIWTKRSRSPAACLAPASALWKFGLSETCPACQLSVSTHVLFAVYFRSRLVTRSILASSFDYHESPVDSREKNLRERSFRYAFHDHRQSQQGLGSRRDAK